jgi:hypothetical protein
LIMGYSRALRLVEHWFLKAEYVLFLLEWCAR